MLIKQAQGFIGATLHCGDYRRLCDRVSGAVIYCDPPYAGTTSYCHSFDSQAFWRYVNELSKTNIVLVSESTAPEGWMPVLVHSTTRSVRASKTKTFTDNVWIREERV